MRQKSEEPTNYSEEKQRELFSEFETVSAKKGSHPFRKDAAFGKKITLKFSYENIILLSIGIIMLIVIFFSLGVEKGKKIAMRDKNIRFAEQAPEPAVKRGEAIIKKDEDAVVAAEKAVAPVAESYKEAEEAVREAPSKPYTIQVIAFKNEKNAVQEVERLKKSGYKAFIAPSGEWAQVCVGRYENREASKEDFTALKEKYPGCYFRRVEN